MHITRTGLFLCLLYVAASAACVVWAQFVTDPKGKYVILQMPIVLQHGVLLAVDAAHILRNMSWPSLYLVLGVPMMGFLFLVGGVVELVYSKICVAASTLHKASHRTGR